MATGENLSQAEICTGEPSVLEAQSQVGVCPDKLEQRLSLVMGIEGQIVGNFDKGVMTSVSCDADCPGSYREPRQEGLRGMLRCLLPQPDHCPKRSPK